MHDESSWTTSRERASAKYAAVATTKCLLLVNLHDHRVIPVEFHRPEYYGISWFPDDQNLVLSHSHLNNELLRGIEQYAMSELGTLSRGVHESPPFLSAPHQILCAPDGRVICTNTGRNAITVFDFNSPTFFQERRLSTVRWDRLSLEQRLGDHLNSVFLRDQRLYVLAHGHQRGSSVATLSYPELDIVSLDKLAWGTGMHNIWSDANGQRIACHSETGAVIDLEDGRTLWTCGSQMFTRGLAITADLVLVGESQTAERENRQGTTSGLWLIDRETWSTLDYICLGPYGMVHEVRVLDALDEAHHGHCFAGLEQLLSCRPGQQLRQSRLQVTTLIQADKVAWKDFRTIFGAPQLSFDHERSIGENQLCLMIQPASAGAQVWQLAFRYDLSLATGQAHAAAVYYWGTSDDTKMLAFLIQAKELSAQFSLWVNEGQEWKCMREELETLLPMSGQAALSLEDGVWNFSVDGTNCVQLDAQPFLANEGSFGIRFSGANVKPPV